MVDSLPGVRGLDAAGLHAMHNSGNSHAALEFLNPFASNIAHLSTTISPDPISPALTIAAREGNLATTRDLIDAGANPYMDLPAEHSPLFEAARNGHVKVTQLLLAERLRRGLWGQDRHLRDGRLIREAEERGDVEMVMLLSMEPEDVLSAEDLDRSREGRGRSDSVISP
jgi:ankyrin repeat protein